MHACTSGPSDRTTLERLVADGKTPQKIVARARIVLLSGCGVRARIASSARLGYRSRRFGAGRKPTWMVASSACSRTWGKGARAGTKPISAEVRLAIVKRTAQEKPKHATHWSARMLAEEIGVGHTTVQRVWKEHGLKPHLTRPFKLSNDPKFAEKVSRHCRALPQSTRQGQSCSASTRKARFKRSIVRNRACR